VIRISLVRLDGSGWLRNGWQCEDNQSHGAHSLGYVDTMVEMKVIGNVF
jgi:hypothetical protein